MYCLICWNTVNTVVEAHEEMKWNVYGNISHLASYISFSSFFSSSVPSNSLSSLSANNFTGSQLTFTMTVWNIFDLCHASYFFFLFIRELHKLLFANHYFWCLSPRCEHLLAANRGCSCCSETGRVVLPSNCCKPNPGAGCLPRRTCLSTQLFI